MSGTIYGFNHETLWICCMVNADYEMEVLYSKSYNICAYFVYFKSKKELNYDRLKEPNILGAPRLVYSYLQIYRISFFLLDVSI